MSVGIGDSKALIAPIKPQLSLFALPLWGENTIIFAHLDSEPFSCVIKCIYRYISAAVCTVQTYSTYQNGAFFQCVKLLKKK